MKIVIFACNYLIDNDILFHISNISNDIRQIGTESASKSSETLKMFINDMWYLSSEIVVVDPLRRNLSFVFIF